MTKKQEKIIKAYLAKFRDGLIESKQELNSMIINSITESFEKDLDKYLARPSIKKLFDNKSQL